MASSEIVHADARPVILDEFGSPMATVQRSAGLSQYAQLWLRGQEQRSGGQRVARPYRDSNPVYAIVSAIVEAASQVPLCLSDASDDLIESGPLYDFLRSPTAELDQSQWLAQLIGHLTLSGVAYLVMADSGGLAPRQAQVCGRMQVRPVFQQGIVVGYEYRPFQTQGPGGGDWYGDTIETMGAYINVSVMDVVPFRTFNPYGVDGADPLRAAELDVIQHREADVYNASALANAAEPGGALQTDQFLQEDQIKQIREQWESRHVGPAAAKRMAVLYGGLKWQQIASTNVDMQFIELRKESKRALCSIFHWPAPLMGIEDPTYSNYNVAQRVGWDVCLSPKLTLICSVLTRHLAPRFTQRSTSARRRLSAGQKAWSRRVRAATPAGVGVWIWPDLDTVPVIQQERRERTKQLKSLLDSGVTLKDAVDVLDLGVDTSNYAWQNTFFIPATMVPADQLIADAAMPPEPPAPEGSPLLPAADEGRGVKDEGRPDSSLVPPPSSLVLRMSPRQRARLWRAWVASWEPLAKAGRQRLRRFWLELERNILGRLPHIVADPLLRAMGAGVIAKADVPRILRLIFDLTEQTGKLVATLRTVYAEGATLGVEQVASEVGLSPDRAAAVKTSVLADPRITQFAARKTPILAKTLATVRERVGRAVAEGLDAGGTVTEIAARCEQAVKDQMTLVKNRSLTIARTETAQIVSAARHKAMADAGVSGKAWLTSGDDHVRDTHRAAGEQYGPDSPIPVDQPFVVGTAQLMHPSDPSGPPEEIINCRCCEIARRLVA